MATVGTSDATVDLQTTLTSDETTSTTSTSSSTTTAATSSSLTTVSSSTFSSTDSSSTLSTTSTTQKSTSKQNEPTTTTSTSTRTASVSTIKSTLPSKATSVQPTRFSPKPIQKVSSAPPRWTPWRTPSIPWRTSRRPPRRTSRPTAPATRFYPLGTTPLITRIFSLFPTTPGTTSPSDILTSAAPTPSGFWLSTERLIIIVLVAVLVLILVAVITAVCLVRQRRARRKRRLQADPSLSACRPYPEAAVASIKGQEMNSVTQKQVGTVEKETPLQIWQDVRNKLAAKQEEKEREMSGNSQERQREMMTQRQEEEERQREMTCQADNYQNSFPRQNNIAHVAPKGKVKAMKPPQMRQKQQVMLPEKARPRSMLKVLQDRLSQYQQRERVKRNAGAEEKAASPVPWQQQWAKVQQKRRAKQQEQTSIDEQPIYANTVTDKADSTDNKDPISFKDLKNKFNVKKAQGGEDLRQDYENVPASASSSGSTSLSEAYSVHPAVPFLFESSTVEYVNVRKPSLKGSTPSISPKPAG